MANTPPPRIEINGMDASLDDLYSSISALNPEAHGAVKALDKLSDEALELKAEVSGDSTLYKDVVGIKNADPGHMISKSAAAVSKFAENSAVIMKSLDAIKQIHPFISVVVIAFQAAIQLELQRRENDKQVIALKTEMMKMVEILLDLRMIKDAQRVYTDGMTLEGRMQSIVTEAAQNIRDCSAICEKYIKKTFIVKLFDGSRWQERLAAFTDTFSRRRKEFSFAMLIHTAQGVDNVQHTLVNIDARVKSGSDSASMLLLFQQLESPKERELQKWIKDKGGAQVVSEDKMLFKELQNKMKDINDRIPGQRDKNESTESLMLKIREEMREDINSSLARDRLQFDRKFKAVQDNLEEMMKTTVDRSTDRIISTVEGGPHERIRDKDLHTVWKDMAWRGSVKARHFIVAVQDYFLEKYSNEDQKMDNSIHAAEEAISRPTSPALSAVTSGSDELLEPPSIMVRRTLEEQAAQRQLEDRWAIEYITLARVRPILEAFDDDASGWISIREANVFTSSRPQDYTVVKWLAFWAAGFKILCARYATGVENVRTHMVTISADVLPCNRACVDHYMCNSSLEVIDLIVRDMLEGFDDHYDEDEALMSNFMDHIASEETRLTEGLERFGWEIDEYNTLQIIAGSGRIERHILPLISLVLQRHTRMIQLACKQPLDDRELRDAEASVDIIASAIFLRILTLESNFRSQKLTPQNEFEVAYNGMFKTAYVFLTVTEDRGELNWEYPESYIDLLGEFDEKILKYEAPEVGANVDTGCFHQNVGCDSCGGPVVGARYKCLECTVPATGDGVDLCENCKDKSVFVATKDLTHNPTAHVLIKSLRSIYHRRRTVILRWASEKNQKATEIFSKAETEQEDGAEMAREESSDAKKNVIVMTPECFYCHRRLARPCWFCVECPDDCFICEECEATQVKMSQFDAPQDTVHKWYHILIEVKEIEPEVPRVELDMRLAMLEQKFAEHESATRQKLESLEAIVAKLGEKVDTLSGLEGLLTRLLAKMGD